MTRVDAYAARSMTDPEKPRQTSRFGLVGIHREGVVIAATGVGHMVLAAPQRTMHPGIDQIKGQRRMDTNGRVQAVRWLPGTLTHTGHILALHPCWMQWHHLAITGHHMAALDVTIHLDLDAFER